MVLLLTPAFTNQTDRVEKTRRIGSPEEKPKKAKNKAKKRKTVKKKA